MLLNILLFSKRTAETSVKVLLNTCSINHVNWSDGTKRAAGHLAE